MRVPAERIVTTSVATAAHLRETLPSGARVLVIGEPALRRAIVSAGFTLTTERPSAVVAGLDRRITYRKLALATQALLRGSAFIATNPDPLLPTARGFAPGAGAMLAALRYSSGRTPTVIGKPRPFMLREALRRLGATAARSAMVGDQLSTDIVAGRAAGTFTIYVRSGISESGRSADRSPRPDLTVKDLPELQAWFARRF
jgi:4-nitrophenyl phosphatase